MVLLSNRPPLLLLATLVQLMLKAPTATKLQPWTTHMDICQHTCLLLRVTAAASLDHANFFVRLWTGPTPAIADHHALTCNTQATSLPPSLTIPASSTLTSVCAGACGLEGHQDAAVHPCTGLKHRSRAPIGCLQADDVVWREFECDGLVRQQAPVVHTQQHVRLVWQQLPATHKTCEPASADNKVGQIALQARWTSDMHQTLAAAHVMQTKKHAYWLALHPSITACHA